MQARRHRAVVRRALVGGAAIDATGSALPDETLQACQRADAVLLGAVGGPKWDDPTAKVRPEQGLLACAAALGLYANLRPVRSIRRSPTCRRSRPSGSTASIRVRARADRRHLFRPAARRDKMRAASAPTTRSNIPMSKSAASCASPSGWRASARGASRRSTKRSARIVALVAADGERGGGGVPDGGAGASAGRFGGDAARDRAGEVRRHRHGEHVRRHPDRRSGRAGRLAGPLAVGVPRRRRARPVRADSRLRPDIANRGIANPLGTIASAAMLWRHSLVAPATAAHIERAIDRTLADGLRTADLGGALGTEELTRAVVERL